MKSEVKKKMRVRSRALGVSKSRRENFQGKSQLKNESRSMKSNAATTARGHEASIWWSRLPSNVSRGSSREAACAGFDCHLFSCPRIYNDWREIFVGSLIHGLF
jgi:hypothetical protein